MDHVLSRGSSVEITKNPLFPRRQTADHVLTKGASCMASATDDRALLASFRDGNDEAFSELVSRYQALVVNACRRQVPSADRDDCVQAVFIVLARRPAAAMRAPALAAWLHRVCTYVCLNARRTRNRRGPDMNSVEISSTAVPSSDAPVDTTILAHLDTALLRLSEKQRAAVLLHAENYSAQDIAGRLGVTSDNAYKLTQRGLSGLRAYFARLGAPVGAATLITLLSGNVASAAPVSVPAAAVILSSAKAGAGGTLAQGAAASLTYASVKTALIAASLVAVVGTSLFFVADVLRAGTTAETPAKPVVAVGDPPTATNNEAVNVEEEKRAAEAALAMRVPKYLTNYYYRYSNTIPEMPAAVTLYYDTLFQAHETALQQALTQWMQKDPASAARWALTIRDFSTRKSMLPFVGKTWSETDAQGAAVWALGIADISTEDKICKQRTFNVILEAWSKKDPKQAAAWINNLPSTNKDVSSKHPWHRELSWHLVNNWSAQDPSAALTWVNAIQDEKLRLDMKYSFTLGFIKADPIKALAWIDENYPQDKRKRTRFLAIEGISLQQCEDLLAHVTDENERSLVMWTKANRLASTNWQQAFEFARAHETLAIYKRTENESGQDRFSWPVRVRSNAALKKIISEGAKTEPQKAVLLVNDIAGDKTDVLNQLGKTWAEHDPEQATLWSQSLANTYTMKEALYHAASLWAYKDPTKALAWHSSLPEEQRFDGLNYAVAMSCGLTDFEQAYALAGHIKNDRERITTYARLLGHLSDSDPKRAIALAAPLNLGNNKRDVSKQIAAIWSEHDPEAASVWAEHIEDSVEKRAALEEVSKSWAAQDPQRAAAWAANVKDSARAQLILNITWVWVKQDLEQATAWASALDDESLKKTALSQVVQYWTNIDGERAASYVMNIPDENLRKSLLQVVAQYYPGDQRKKLAWATSLADEDDRTVAVTSVVERWALHEIDAAKTWAEALTPGAVRTAALCQIAITKSRVAPAQAAELVMKQDAGSVRSNAIKEIYKRWINVEPLKAATWIMSLESNDGRKDAVAAGMSSVFYHSKQPDQRAAVATIFATKTQGDERKETMMRIAGYWILKDVEKLAAWATSLEDPETKEVAVRAVASAWSHRDAAKAAAWIKTLDAATQERLLKGKKEFVPEPKPVIEDANDF